MPKNDGIFNVPFHKTNFALKKAKMGDKNTKMDIG